MNDDARGRDRRRRRLWLAVAVAAVIVAVLVVPPLVSVSRYKSQITHLMSASLGRPVHLSSVEMRLLPSPGLVLTDLTVEEDPAFGAAPVLHANTVRASLRLLSLWRGRLEISRISVDEASLNVVRTVDGRWNLDPLFHTATARTQAGQGAAGARRNVVLPYLEATNSRINIMRGSEKLPFSLVNTDLSLWQEGSGDWHIRLRGQPARTDVSLALADTGVVRLEATMGSAAELRTMPVHLDLDWREAQLGQLTRLVIGSDPGWRGDLAGELHLDGTAEAAQIKTRLRAAGVHRAEFAPAAPLDFDANCSLTYHYSRQELENLMCDSPLGDGSIHFAGSVPGEGGVPRFSVELDRVPVGAALDALRTVRSDLNPGLEARGAISGKMMYTGEAPGNGVDEQPIRGTKQVKAGRGKESHGRVRPVVQGPLTGSFSVEGFQLSGGGLRTPLDAPKAVVEPAAVSEGQPQALTATVAIQAGGPVPLTVTARLASAGYQMTVHGQAALARARELAQIAGMADSSALDAMAGDSVTVDLTAEGPWMTAERTPFTNIASERSEAEPTSLSGGAGSAVDRLSGTVVLHNVNWKADFLANHLEISEATVHLGNGGSQWDPVVFAYGPVKGTASLDIPARCDAVQPCAPKFQVQFGALDAVVLQAAILGAHQQGTLLSELIARISPSTSSTAAAWPELEGKVKADSLILGPVILQQPSANLRILANGAEMTELDAGLLGGRVHAEGTLRMPATGQAKPGYLLQGRFEKLNPAAVGPLLGLRWSGGTFEGDGKVDLSGFTDKDLTASAKGTLHFEWRHGSVGAQLLSPAGAQAVSDPVRFSRWTGDAEIADGAITLKQNQMLVGARSRSVAASVSLGTPPKVTFGPQRETQARR